jgi:two-component system cell cycle sensor histidine kinase/response regulator CckA
VNEDQKSAGTQDDPGAAQRVGPEPLETLALMRAALEASLFAVVVLEPTGRIVYCNEQAAQLLGLTPSRVERRTFDAPQWKHTDMNGGPWLPEQQPFTRVMKTGEKVVGVEHRIERPDGRDIALRINGAPIKGDDGQIRLVVFSFEDITERRALEEGLRRSQQMEAIGRLAAGVAHDFNNLLTVILASADLAAHDPNDPELVLEMIGAIREAGERATTMTRQLLAVGRRGLIRPVVFDAVREVVSTVRLIERMVGERVRVRLVHGDEPLWLSMDPGHLQQVLINLAINARDAMRSGGTLTLSLAREEPLPDGSKGRARIRVRDEGSGMDEATRARAFEPFFTTKPAHEGTGLGLFTCQRIVREAGGSIALESAPGHGTTVEIALPLTDPPPMLAQQQSGVPIPARGHGTLLVVEDDPMVRYIATRALEEAGYDVRAARDARDAALLAEAQRFDLVVCDVELSDGSGPGLIQTLRGLHPELRVLFVSGFGLALPEGADAPFLPKPYSSDDLLRRVAELLASGDGSAQRAS